MKLPVAILLALASLWVSACEATPPQQQPALDTAQDDEDGPGGGDP